MQSSSDSQSSSEASGTPLPSPTLQVPSMNDEFSIDSDGAKILQEYLDDFQDGDTELRATIVANAMAELYDLRPEDAPFDKTKASQVCYPLDALQVS
jgi:hypothetical protein